MWTPPFRQADNPGPFTLEGSRAYKVGIRRAVLVDPGPDDPRHVRQLLDLLEGACEVTLALTHGHRDHAGAVDSLLNEFERQGPGRPTISVVGPGHPRSRPLIPGERLLSDQGEVRVVPTPGHTRDHVSYHWIEGRSLFAGDLLLGVGVTTWVGEYPGAVQDFLTSLDRVEAAGTELVLPTHGPPIRDVAGTIRGYRKHRLARVEAARDAWARVGISGGGGAADAQQLQAVAEAVYGAELLQSQVGWAALSSTAALLAHLGCEVGREFFRSEDAGGG